MQNLGNWGFKYVGLLGNWGFKYLGVQDRAYKLYPGSYILTVMNGVQ